MLWFSGYHVSSDSVSNSPQNNRGFSSPSYPIGQLWVPLGRTYGISTRYVRCGVVGFFFFYFFFSGLGWIWVWHFIGVAALRLGEGNGTPLQYSCLENPLDGGAWWAGVHGVTKSLTRLSDFTFTFHFHALEKEMATHSSVLARRIPGTEEPGGLPSMGSHRVGHDWSDLAAAAAAALRPSSIVDFF